VWISDPEEKQTIIETYKKKLSVIPCKHYSHGINSCPFGTSCFYAHASEDGALEKPSVRTVVNSSEKITVCRDTRLSDFIVFKQK
jgi:E3 ubiquitin-protein ligase makorin